MSFEMRKLTSFPMQKLCYDLKLEVLEQMRPEDAIELVKVKMNVKDEGFRSILLRTPWLVFGRHVHLISLEDGIMRRPHDSCLRLNVALHFPLFKRIHSCDVFDAWRPERFPDQNAAILKHLKSVKKLDLSVDTNELLLKFLENFRSVVGECAVIDVDIDLLKENQVISDLFENFIANQMNDCEKVCFDCTSAAAFHFYYALFAKTSIKFLQIPGGYVVNDRFEKVVQSIVEKGIPSKNLKAAIYVYDCDTVIERADRIVDFVSRFPRMERLEGGNQQKVTKIAKEFWAKHMNYRFEFTEESYIFRRNIDSRRDCVYMFGSYTGPDPEIDSDICSGTEFFAFYIHPQSGKMEF